MRTIGIVANPQKPQARETVERVVEGCRKVGLVACVAEDVARKLDLAAPMVAGYDLAASSDVVIACGGDGTILHAARLVADDPRPILGVNLGRLGFLAELSPDDIEEGLAQIARGQFTSEPRMMLQATTDGQETAIIGLNDIIVAKSNLSRIISLEMRESDRWVNTYVADGLIIATPTGSTGYALAAGGPIVTPGVDALVAAPICPHSLTARPMIFRGDAVLRITVIGSSDSRILLSADAQMPPVPLESGQVVTVTRASHDAQLLHLEASSYYDILRQKLHWGMDKSFV